MTPVVKTQTGVGSTAWIPVNYRQSPFNLSFGVVVSGTVDYTVQHTYENVMGGESATARNHGTIAAATANAEGSYTVPIRAIRVTVNSGAGSVTLTVLQGTNS